MADLGIQPSVMAIFHTCVSTGKSGLFRQNINTHDTVFGPTPLKRESSFFTASSSISRRYSMHAFPLSSWSVFRMTWMRRTLISASPPHFTAASTGRGSATRTDSHVGNARFRLANATALVASVVFWDRMVPTKESSTGLTAGGLSFGSSVDPPRATVPCRIVYGVSAEGSARTFESAEGDATPRLPGPSWFDPSA